MLIGRASRKELREVGFSEIADQLTDLLKEFGPSRSSYHPEYPFWHLCNSEFWHVQDAEDMPLKKSGHSPTKKTLLNFNAIGCVKKDLWQELLSNKSLRIELSDKLLYEFWPETLHSAIRQSVGLLDTLEISRSSKKRDPRFRLEVLRAYKGECAVCGFDGRLKGVPLGIQAAHIKWHSYNGPDDLANGLALCSFHHLALDSGAIGLDHSRRIVVSCDVTGSTQIEELLYQYEGKTIQAPQPGISVPREEYIEWHQNQVFKKPARLWYSGEGSGSIAAEPAP